MSVSSHITWGQAGTPGTRAQGQVGVLRGTMHKQVFCSRFNLHIYLTMLKNTIRIHELLGALLISGENSSLAQLTEYAIEAFQSPYCTVNLD